MLSTLVSLDFFFIPVQEIHSPHVFHSAVVSRIVTGHSRGVAPSLKGWKHRC